MPLAIDIIDDFVAEGTEAFVITLGLPAGPKANSVLIDLDQSTIIIADDDGN